MKIQLDSQLSVKFLPLVSLAYSFPFPVPFLGDSSVVSASLSPLVGDSS